MIHTTTVQLSDGSDPVEVVKIISTPATIPVVLESVSTGTVQLSDGSAAVEVTKVAGYVEKQ
jgi:hypothetical protein